MSKSAIVIGAGIVGLATARALATRGYQVTVIERSTQAVGASIRNFGMVWPIGQPEGKLYERALHAKSIWKEVLAGAKCWSQEAGSLHMAYQQDELEVIQQFVEVSPYRPVSFLNAEQTLAKSPAVNPDGLLGALYSADEMIVDPREAIAAIPGYLTAALGVTFIWNTAISQVTYPAVLSGSKSWSADEIFVCSGQDFETLYPEQFSAAPLTKCKLQMMRLEAQPDDWRIGPALCGGLSFIHYHGFKAAASLPGLKARYESEYAEYLKWGIHVMASQNGLGEITVGDSHEYALTFDPFDREFINTMILDYLGTFAQFKSPKVYQSWHGIYPKMTNGATEIVLKPESGVTIINGLGGNGMTLSFGLCDEVVGGTYQS
ncbi:FAD dependent oxidoreductase TIGR03364 [Dyadobacter sp. BE34]|uniref:FAD dependent oxidoreductase TIGR03364 n=1 Tax=Dyadobacter fermentans TaxID=94254 RepID=A0ABU1R4D1_9BACT|nr:MULTISPECIES: TIGR03364 family FAD-dependent oxidoreductase [Dyadobacter]MDR6808271.1 FAD dependent oxidoreductase TIGR03364 [Dyadobacter fermentans]MDR7045913.1 FAD dependent oxidoreductase TIGR03364 [Dyadobacter sp. BE242]MDR7200226.1 FAD dependent oxidoreductase TIGR03364 [Dyadobacter sp. BE34]MDR7218186.1 FAD dependent oxidoreductase TIGR03364 [Dyadobacter sp. BE31]MDR7266117.1 FAD dependent oxidoreductase TIGR03364 [Dyadobacter sp. BE32]